MTVVRNHSVVLDIGDALRDVRVNGYAPSGVGQAQRHGSASAVDTHDHVVVGKSVKVAVDLDVVGSAAALGGVVVVQPRRIGTPGAVDTKEAVAGNRAAPGPGDELLAAQADQDSPRRSSAGTGPGRGVDLSAERRAAPETLGGPGKSWRTPPRNRPADGPGEGTRRARSTGRSDPRPGPDSRPRIAFRSSSPRGPPAQWSGSAPGDRTTRGIGRSGPRCAMGSAWCSGPR